MNKKHVFTLREKRNFLEILSNYKHIIESKELSGATFLAKKCAWDNITKEYNASPDCLIQVSSKQLRRLWMNLKQRQRESVKKDPSQLVINGGDHLSVALERCEKIIGKDYTSVEQSNRHRRAEEIHQLELKLLSHKVREAKAKADLAELIFAQRQSTDCSMKDEDDQDQLI